MDSDQAVRPRGRPRDPSVDDDILRAAIELLTESGFDKFSMEAVAARAGVAKATLYRRHASRIDLLVATCQSFAPAVGTAPDTGDVRDDLCELVRGLIRTLLTSDTGGLMPAMVSAAKENAEIREALQRFSSSRRGRVHQVVQRAIERGELRPDARTDVVADMVVGSTMYRLLFRGGDADDRFVDDLVDGILGGFTSEARRVPG